MLFSSAVWIKIALSCVIAGAISFASTPIVKMFAERVGAIDVPKEARRVHDHPIPRMGGLAIFFGFLLTVILFADITNQVRGILFGSIMIVAMGAIDDVMNLKPWIKLAVQIVAAVVAVAYGVVIHVLSNPAVLSENAFLAIGYLAVPVTVLWIVGCTNAVNLIDGLDGLACGVSVISSVTMLVVALMVAEANVAVVLAALTGACIGFLPYNFNPAKLFMGDTGSQLLGYVLATVSVMGMFKYYAVVTFLVPLLALAIPLCDTVFAFFRRLLHGQSPFKADRGHFHHKLLDMGLSQKQAVAVLYSVSAILGLLAVVMASRGIQLRLTLGVAAFVIAIAMWFFVFRGNRNIHPITTDEAGNPIPEKVAEEQAREEAREEAVEEKNGQD
jgi:UDP-GlcNAc:undecaprenyl-phosphate GlcNAc-1-phosphate transferase